MQRTKISQIKRKLKGNLATYDFVYYGHRFLFTYFPSLNTSYFTFHLFSYINHKILSEESWANINDGRKDKMKTQAS